jgi:hypothetical protein
MYLVCVCVYTPTHCATQLLMDLGWVTGMTSVFEFKSSEFHFLPQIMEMEWQGTTTASFTVSFSRN